jgi:hypothetical protein
VKPIGPFYHRQNQWINRQKIGQLHFLHVDMALDDADVVNRYGCSICIFLVALTIIRPNPTLMPIRLNSDFPSI